MLAGFFEKLGFWSDDIIKTWKSKSGWIWFHAVSVGELNAVWPLILEINKTKSQHPIMISCTTNAGYNLAKELTKEKDILLFYFPFDIPQTIKSLLNLAKLKLFIIAETEIWPNVLGECKKRSIPVILVNAKLSDKSFKNYYLLRFYFKHVVNSLTKILAQSENDAIKFKNLGVEENKIKTLGNIKFSSLISETNGKQNTENTNKDTQKTIIFASTHKGEEKIAINIYKNLLEDFPDIKLIIAPRHINRVQDIVSLIKSKGFVGIRKTENKKINSRNEIFILDTIGELQNYYKQAQITVLGGTFSKIGGHNILEPIRAGSYTIIGPYDFKIQELTNLFKQKNAIVQVTNTNELIARIKEALINQDVRNKTIENGIKLIKENSDVLQQTYRQILAYL